MAILRRLALLGVLLSCAFAQEQKITILATSDLHGNIYPWDYYTAKPANRGLAKIATIVKRVRAENPNTIVIDCGDTIQGSPLEFVYQHHLSTGSLPAGVIGAMPAGDPMMLAMNRIGFAAMTLGNHEFNFGQNNLDRARADARFPWLAANVINERKNYLRYTVVRAGTRIRIVIIGVTPPVIPLWEKAENIAGYQFLPIVDAVRETMAEVRHQERDVVIVAAHSGLGKDLKTGADDHSSGGENAVYDVAQQVPGIDAIIFGHTHRELHSATLNNVALLQPKALGASVGRLDMTLRRIEHGWEIVSKSTGVIPVTEDTPADPEILELARPYHELAEAYLNTTVAESPQTLDAAFGRLEDNALVDAIHQVQLHYTKADVSLTALFNPRVRIPKGPVTVRQLAALYYYENELLAIEGNGKMLKDALENAARYFGPAGAGLNKAVFGFNFDIAQGVNYEIDLSRPEGSRIRNLTFRGKPLKPDQKLKIAVNDYRAGGSGGYTMFRDAPVLWRSYRDIRQMMVDYFSRQKRFSAAPDGNWRIVPPAAAARLRPLFRQAAEMP